LTCAVQVHQHARGGPCIAGYVIVGAAIKAVVAQAAPQFVGLRIADQRVVAAAANEAREADDGRTARTITDPDRTLCRKIGLDVTRSVVEGRRIANLPPPTMESLPPKP